jgi:hypothetical protein
MTSGHFKNSAIAKMSKRQHQKRSNTGTYIPKKHTESVNARNTANLFNIDRDRDLLTSIPLDTTGKLVR